MQFGGQRTSLDLEPIGEPHRHFIKMTDEVLPEPDAIMVTGITPQQTIADGMTEAEFLKLFHEEIAVPNTIFVGFNSVRFDDEFMRFLHYRNFYDPYEWQWADGRSKWDLLDLVRMTRALRPDGIEWPFDPEGKPANKLEYLTNVNKLDHADAHDALSDVLATIAVAKLVKEKQPDIFNFLLKVRDKEEVKKVVVAGQPFVYTSGKYEGANHKTTVVSMVCEHPVQSGGAFVFDLRYDPIPFAGMTVEQIVEAWKWKKDRPADEPALPVKTLKYNRCPAVAPLGVLNANSQERIHLSEEVYLANYKKLIKVQTDLCEKLIQAVKLMDKQQQARLLEDEIDVDARMYEGFFDSKDKTTMAMVRATESSELTDLEPTFVDDRLRALWPLYKARNFPKTLSDNDRHTWEQFKERRLMGGKNASRAAKYFERLAQLAEQPRLTAQQKYLLEELQLWGQSILPSA